MWDRPNFSPHVNKFFLKTDFFPCLKTVSSWSGSGSVGFVCRLRIALPFQFSICFFRSLTPSIFSPFLLFPPLFNSKLKRSSRYWSKYIKSLNRRKSTFWQGVGWGRGARVGGGGGRLERGRNTEKRATANWRKFLELGSPTIMFRPTSAGLPACIPNCITERIQILQHYTVREQG